MKHPNNKSINILHICSWYPNRINEFEGVFIERHIKSTLSFSVAYNLAVIEDPNLKQWSEWVWKTEDNLTSLIIYYRPYQFKLIKILQRFFFYFRGYQALKLKASYFDGIHAHVILYGAVLSILLNIITGIP
jgi:hypothetical protein